MFGTIENGWTFTTEGGVEYGATITTMTEKEALNAKYDVVVLGYELLRHIRLGENLWCVVISRPSKKAA